MIHSCTDLKYDKNGKCVFFDGSSDSIVSLKRLLFGTNQLNMNTLYTKINWWCIKYDDDSVIWKRNKCFNTYFKINK